METEAARISLDGRNSVSLASDHYFNKLVNLDYYAWVTQSGTKETINNLHSDFCILKGMSAILDIMFWNFATFQYWFDLTQVSDTWYLVLKSSYMSYLMIFQTT